MFVLTRQFACVHYVIPAKTGLMSDLSEHDIIPIEVTFNVWMLWYFGDDLELLVTRWLTTDRRKGTDRKGLHNEMYMWVKEKGKATLMKEETMESTNTHPFPLKTYL